MTASKTWRLGDFAAVRPEAMCGAVEVLWAIKGMQHDLRPTVSMLDMNEAEFLGKQLQLIGRALVKASQEARDNAKKVAT